MEFTLSTTDGFVDTNTYRMADAKTVVESLADCVPGEEQSIVPVKLTNEEVQRYIDFKSGDLMLSLLRTADYLGDQGLVDKLGDWDIVSPDIESERNKIERLKQLKPRSFTIPVVQLLKAAVDPDSDKLRGTWSFQFGHHYDPSTRSVLVRYLSERSHISFWKVSPEGAEEVEIPRCTTEDLPQRASPPYPSFIDWEKQEYAQWDSGRTYFFDQGGALLRTQDSAAASWRLETEPRDDLNVPDGYILLATKRTVDGYSIYIYALNDVRKKVLTYVIAPDGSMAKYKRKVFYASRDLLMTVAPSYNYRNCRVLEISYLRKDGSLERLHRMYDITSPSRSQGYINDWRGRYFVTVSNDLQSVTVHDCGCLELPDSVAE